MKANSKSLVFFGSGPVAAKSLEFLSENFQIEAVVTKPRPTHHRGPVPVLEIAKKLGLKVYTASNKSELDSLIDNSTFKSPLGVLIDFGIIVSKKAIDYFELGIINSHFSILPEWRGADPITFAILSGQKTTGVSLMLLVAAMDEGPLLAYGESEMQPGIKEPELTDELIKLSDALLVDTIPRYQQGQASPMPQTITGRQTSYSRKISKEDGVIDWQKPAEQIEREIRAFCNWPKSRSILAEQDVVITEVKVTGKKGNSGTVVVEDKKLLVCCGSQALEILRLKPAGKKEMSAEAFLAGYGNKIN